MGLRNGVGRVLRGAANHPVPFMAAAAGVGLAGSTLDAINEPANWELATGDPNFPTTLAKSAFQASFFEDFDHRDRTDPVGAFGRKGQIHMTPNYVNGRVVQGQKLSGDPTTGMFGGAHPPWEPGGPRQREEPIATGNLVLGLYGRSKGR